jgi:hypothetical protein
MFETSSDWLTIWNRSVFFHVITIFRRQNDCLWFRTWLNLGLHIQFSRGVWYKHFVFMLKKPTRVGHPAWGLGVELTALHFKNLHVTKCQKKKGLGFACYEVSKKRTRIWQDTWHDLNNAKVHIFFHSKEGTYIDDKWESCEKNNWTLEK